MKSPPYFSGDSLLGFSNDVGTIEGAHGMSPIREGQMIWSDATPPAGFVTPELVQLLAIARRELDRHLSDHGTCTCCHEHWPCPTACLAADTLSAL